MRLDLNDRPAGPDPDEPQIGDLYTIGGGPGKGRRYQAIVAISGNTCYMLVFDGLSGEITGTGTCTDYYLNRKGKVGRIQDLPDLRVDWHAY